MLKIIVILNVNILNVRMKHFLFVDNMIVYIEKSMEFKKLELISKFNKVIDIRSTYISFLNPLCIYGILY